MDKVRKHFIFHGYVQGVGFRWKASHTARRLGISGWVKNLSDGTVEMEAEGGERDIADLIEALKDHSWGSIENIDEQYIPVHGDYSFEVV